MPAIINIQCNLVWKFGRTKHGNYVGICDAIGQTVQANRFSELVQTINEALDSTFKELLSSGDLEKFLRDRGWKSAHLPTPQQSRNVRFDIPFELNELKGVQRRDLQEAVC